MHWRRTSRVAWLFGLAALLAACSGIPLKEREAAERARIESYAGQPLRHFTWFGRFDGWKAVSRDEALQCRIELIRPVDYGRLRADLRRERESRQASAAAARGGDG